MSNSAIPRTIALLAPLSMEFSRQEYWSGLPFPSLGDLPDPGIKPRSPGLQADSLLLEPPGKPIYHQRAYQIISHSASFNFPHNSVGKESTCNAGDPSSIPGLGRSPRKGKGYPLQYSSLENSMNTPRGGKELDMTERLSLHFTFQHNWFPGNFVFYLRHLKA